MLPPTTACCLPPLRSVLGYSSCLPLALPYSAQLLGSALPTTTVLPPTTTAQFCGFPTMRLPFCISRFVLGRGGLACGLCLYFKRLSTCTLPGEDITAGGASGSFQFTAPFPRLHTHTAIPLLPHNYRVRLLVLSVTTGPFMHILYYACVNSPNITTFPFRRRHAGCHFRYHHHHYRSSGSFHHMDHLLGSTVRDSFSG